MAHVTEAKAQSPAPSMTPEERLHFNLSATSVKLSRKDESSLDHKCQHEAEEKPTQAQIVLLMITLSLSTFIAAVEQTIVATAVPTIAAFFQVSAVEYVWIGSSYLLPVAAATPPWGKMSDIFGRKPILLLAILVFLAGSLIGALSTNIRMLIAGRALQGTGGGGILGLSATIIGDVFSPRDRSKYFGILSVVWGISCGLGPILGGAFAQYVSWRWCFWINLPIGSLAIIFVFFYLNVETPKTPIMAGILAMDWLGTGLIVGATLLFLLGLGYGGIAFPWNSTTVIVLIIFGIITLLVFIFVESQVAKYPLIPTRLFRSISNVAAFGIAFIHGFVFIADLFYLPLYFQSVLGATPILSGVYLLPVAVTLCITSSMTGVYISKTGRYRPPIYVGLAFMIIGHGLYIDLQAYPSWPRVIIYQLVAGFGLGPVFQAPIIAIFSLTKPADIASAAATLLFTRDIATAISVVIGGVIFQNRMASHSKELHAILPLEIADLLINGDATAATKLIQTLPHQQRQVLYQVYNNCLRAEWIFYTALSVVGLLFSILISEQALSREHKIAKTGLQIQEDARVEEAMARETRSGIDESEDV